MKKWISTALCLVLLLPVGALAEEIKAGDYARAMEAQAKAAGMELYTETTFVWGGLPLLDAGANAAIDSVFKTFQLDTFSKGDGINGYAGFEARLNGVSVLDMTMHAQDGVYYEQSNLLGGQMAAFTRDDFAAFVRRLSTRSGDAMPREISWMFELAMLLIGGTGNLELQAETLDKALASYDQWRLHALTPIERERPTVHIPGLFGTRAMVTDVTRDEALTLARAVGSLLVSEDSLLEDAVRMQSPQLDEANLRQIVARVDETLRTLPELLEEALPATLPPSEYREVFGPDGALVVRQVEIALPDGAGILVEWVPEGAGMPAVYASVSAGESQATLLLSRELGTPSTIGKTTYARNNTLAELMVIDGDLRVGIIMTRTENHERQTDKETMTAKTDWIIESAALLGDGAIVTVTTREIDKSAGEGTAYARERDTALTIRGLGFDNRTLLSTKAVTGVRGPALPIIAAIEPVTYPAQLNDEEFDAWLADVQVSLVQVAYTVLGRLPKEAAAYMLQLMP